MTDTELASLRREIQADRLALQATINVGFERLSTKVDDHAAALYTLTTRVANIEDRQDTVAKRMWALFVTAVAAAFSWLPHLLGSHK